MKAFVSLTIAAFFAVVSVAHAQNAPNSWTVVLTGKQNAAFQAQKSVKKHTGFAISPDGAWGQSHGFASADAAAARAMSFCRSYMRKGQRDCILFAVNGKVVAPAVVQTKTVQALYKPIDAKAAPSVFGYAPGSFKGNKSAARAEYKALEKNPALRNTMVRDAAFELMLTNRTLMVNENSAFLVWFEPRGASTMPRRTAAFCKIVSKAGSPHPTALCACSMRSRPTVNACPTVVCMWTVSKTERRV
ncbi:hypothetical protein [Shimia sp. SDUM112013]|uniref:hypothetical protein n=1 Tax=Shimia sp. SDUM112013 TaxID=3136160 RepID=UPI0032EB06FF